MTTPFTRNKRVAKPGRVSLIPEEFDNLIEDQGIFVRITPSVLCPNRTEIEDTNHNLNCTLCDNQVIDLTDECYEEWAFIQGVKFDKQFEVQGVFDPKDALMSIKSNVRLWYWYKIEVLDFSSVFNQVMKRGITDIDKTRYELARVGETPMYLIDKLGTKYIRNEDYKIGADNHSIQWIGNTPAAGDLFSFSYPILPTFRVLELMHENRYYYNSERLKEKDPVHLPQQAHIRWDYFAKGSGTGLPKVD